MGKVILFSLTAAFNPTLVAATTVMMLLAAPARLMLAYLCGALLMSVPLGLVIVFTLNGSGAAKTTQHTLSPSADIALGTILLLLARVAAGARVDEAIERRRERRAAEPDRAPRRWQRALSSGSVRVAFVVGALLSLPGASYLAGLNQIHKLGYSDAVSVLLVIGFNVVMLALLEIPLLGFVIAPERTPGAIEQAKAWIGGRARSLAVRGLTIIGALLLLKGFIAFIV